MSYWEEMPEEVLVHWDRDGMADLVSSIDPNMNHLQGKPRIDKVSGHKGYRFLMYYGSMFGVIRAVYVVNPVAHWRAWDPLEKYDPWAEHSAFERILHNNVIYRAR